MTHSFIGGIATCNELRPKTSNCCVSVLWPFNVRITKRKLVAYYRKFRKLTNGTFFYWSNRNEQRVIRPKATKKLIQPHSCGVAVESPLKSNLRKRRTKSCNLKRTRKRKNVPVERYMDKSQKEAHTTAFVRT